MITIEELCADNHKLVDENLKLRKEKANLEEIVACLRENEAIQAKDKEWLSSVIEKRNKRIDEFKKKNAELEAQIEKMKCCPNCKSWDSLNLNFCEKEKRMCGYRACEEWEAKE